MLFGWQFCLTKCRLSVSIFDGDQVVTHVFVIILILRLVFVPLQLPHFHARVVIIVAAGSHPVSLKTLERLLTLVFAQTAVTGVEGTLVFTTGSVDIGDASEVFSTTVDASATTSASRSDRLHGFVASVRRLISLSNLIETVIVFASRKCPPALMGLLEALALIKSVSS